MHNFVSRTKKSLPGNPGNGIRMLLVSIGALLFSLPVFSQANLGRILGAVTDQTGGVIAGAMVTVTNTGTGVARTLDHQPVRRISAPDLIPGTYSVRAGRHGLSDLRAAKHYRGSRPGYSRRCPVDPGPSHPNCRSHRGRPVAKHH